MSGDCFQPLLHFTCVLPGWDCRQAVFVAQKAGAKGDQTARRCLLDCKHMWTKDFKRMVRRDIHLYFYPLVPAALKPTLP